MFVTIGKFGRARGVRGELWVTPLADNSERWLALKEVYVAASRQDRRAAGDWQPFTIELARVIGGRPVLKLATINSPEEAARFTNRELAIPREELAPPPADSYYVVDLVGCTVVDDATGETVGKVEDVYQLPANDVYVIRTITGGEVLFPAVRDFVKHIDIAAKRITVVWRAIADLG